ncbi:hypothetical protein ACOSP7_009282 [Xanthoceras sorbifolium]
MYMLHGIIKVCFELLNMMEGSLVWWLMAPTFLSVYVLYTLFLTSLLNWSDQIAFMTIHFFFLCCFIILDVKFKKTHSIKVELIGLEIKLGIYVFHILTIIRLHI